LSVFSCTVLFVSISQVIGCEDRLRNDLYCVECGVKLYSNQLQPTKLVISYIKWLWIRSEDQGGSLPYFHCTCTRVVFLQIVPEVRHACGSKYTSDLFRNCGQENFAPTKSSSSARCQLIQVDLYNGHKMVVAVL